MLFGEGSSRSAFQVFLESSCFRWIAEADSGFNKPWAGFRGVWNSPTIMLIKACMQVFRAPSVVEILVVFTPKDVDV